MNILTNYRIHKDLFNGEDVVNKHELCVLLYKVVTMKNSKSGVKKPPTSTLPTLFISFHHLPKKFSVRENNN